MVCAYYSDFESSSFRDGLANLFLALDDEETAEMVFRRYPCLSTSSPVLRDFDKHWQLATSVLAELTRGQYSSRLHVNSKVLTDFGTYIGTELPEWKRYFIDARAEGVIHVARKNVRIALPCLTIRTSDLGMVSIVSVGQNKSLYHGLPFRADNRTVGVLEVFEEKTISSLSTS